MLRGSSLGWEPESVTQTKPAPTTVQCMWDLARDSPPPWTGSSTSSPSPAELSIMVSVSSGPSSLASLVLTPTEQSDRDQTEEKTWDSSYKNMSKDMVLNTLPLTHLDTIKCWRRRREISDSCWFIFTVINIKTQISSPGMFSPIKNWSSRCLITTSSSGRVQSAKQRVTVWVRRWERAPTPS